MSEAAKAPADTLPVQLGRHLRAARQARRLELSACAARLRLPVRVLRQLEAGDYAGLDCALYLRNYLTSYGACVGVDQATIDAAIAELAPVSRRPVLVSTGGISRSRYLWQRYTTAATYAVLTAVIVVPLVWLGVKGGLDRELTHLEPLNAAPVGQSEVASADSSTVHTASNDRAGKPHPVAREPRIEKPLMASMAPFSALDSDDLARRVALPTVAANDASGDLRTNGMPAAAVGTHSLTIALSKPSWVEVTTTNGKRLAYSLLAAGTHKSWHSSQPLRVSIGDVRGARVSLDGKPVDLDAFEHGNVAHFGIALHDGNARVTGTAQ
jgi:cytoskeleton protein RodZ